MFRGTDDNQDLLTLVSKMKWVRFPFLWYPKGSLDRRVTMNFIGLCIGYKCIYQDTEFEENNKPTLHKELKQFDLINVLENLARLNFFLSEYHNTRTHLELIFAKQLVPEKVFQKIHGFWKQGRKIFSRQQILALMKTAILNDYSVERKGRTVIEDLHTFGRILFRITDFLDEDTYSKVQRARGRRKRDRILLASLLRNAIFNSSQYFPLMLSRYWTIYFDCLRRVETQYPNEYYRIIEEYEEISGIELEKFMGLAFGIWGHYRTNWKQILKKPEKFWLGPQFFKKVKREVREKAKKIFWLLSKKPEELRNCFKEEEGKNTNYYKFRCIWKRPFLNNKDKAFCPLDMGYLQEKIGYGVYWTLFDEMLDKKEQSSGIEKRKVEKKLNKLATCYGRCLEMYVGDILTRIYGKGDLGRLFSEGSDYQGGADFIISYPDSLIFIEVTKRSLLMKTVWKANLDAIEREIKDIFFGGARYREGKIEQINRSIEQVKNGKVKLPGVEVRKIKKIYPVLITELGLPTFKFRRGYDIKPRLQNCRSMREYYLDMISRKGFFKDCIGNFQYMSIEEFELLEAVIEQGTSMLDIFEKKQKGYDDWPMKYFLYSQRGDNLIMSKYLNGQFQKFVKRISASLFGQS